MATEQFGGVFLSRTPQPSAIGELLEPEFPQFAREIFPGLWFEYARITTLPNATCQVRWKESVLIPHDTEEEHGTARTNDETRRSREHPRLPDVRVVDHNICEFEEVAYDDERFDRVVDCFGKRIVAGG